MSNKKLTLSIVIPAYNEERYLPACLEAIVNQTEAPDEVIVINNNSTDQTAAVAQKYPFVRLVFEKTQGRIHAQNKGFALSSSDIVGRIDADTRLDKNWVKNVKSVLGADKSVSAITGKAFFYDFYFKRAGTVVHSFIYYSLQRFIAGGEILWGSNMAIKKSAWLQVKSQCLKDIEIDEDIDLSLQLHKASLSIAKSSELFAGVSLRRGDLTLSGNIRYLSSWPKTYHRNGRSLQAIATIPIITLLLVGGIPYFIANLVKKKVNRLKQLNAPYFVTTAQPPNLWLNKARNK